jgi:two-component system phosphate regulon sensor histidine kinase PhoR
LNGGWFSEPWQRGVATAVIVAVVLVVLRWWMPSPFDFALVTAGLAALAGWLSWSVRWRATTQVQAFSAWLQQAVERGEAPKLRLDTRELAVSSAARYWEECVQQLLQKLENTKRELARIHGVLQHMTEGLLALDEEGRVTQANSTARRFLGITADPIVGRSMLELVRWPELQALIALVKRKGTPVERELERPGSPRRYLRVRGTRVAGVPAGGVLLSIHDLTRIRQLEQLRREFIANVSHELKTPLAAIRGYAETLQMGAIDDAPINRHFVDQIVSQSHRLESLISDMLQLARAQEGGQALERRPVPVEPVIEECLRTYQPMAKKRRIHLERTSDFSNCVVQGDREALLTIINNLVGNAVRYTPDGGEVQVGCQQADDRWNISVKDTGVGISESDLDRVFERFFRVDKSRSSDGPGGTGLGLSIVKNLTQSLGGEVHVTSQLGKGSTFTVSLPTAVADPLPALPTTGPGSFTQS